MVFGSALKKKRRRKKSTTKKKWPACPPGIKTDMVNYHVSSLRAHTGRQTGHTHTHIHTPKHTHNGSNGGKVARENILILCIQSGDGGGKKNPSINTKLKGIARSETERRHIEREEEDIHL